MNITRSCAAFDFNVMWQGVMSLSHRMIELPRPGLIFCVCVQLSTQQLRPNESATYQRSSLSRRPQALKELLTAVSDQF